MQVNEREYKRQRMKVWESMNGCDCDPKLSRQDKCSRNAIRCNGRLEVVQSRLAGLERQRAQVDKVIEAVKASQAGGDDG